MSRLFKGHVQLDFCDPITGKVKERVEGENTFTNGLTSLLNNVPFGLGKGVFANTAVSGSGDVNVTPLNDIALGGVLVYPQFTNPSNMSDFFEPMSNQPTAYASKLNLGDADSKLGTFSTVESAEVTGGYKNVYEWGTAYGNGVWGAIALCHRRGGNRYYSDFNYMRGIAGGGYYKNVVGGYENIIGCRSDGFFTVDRTNPNKVSFYSLSKSKVLLMQDFSSLVQTTPTWTKTFSLSPDPVTVYSESEDKLYLFSTSGSTSIAVTVVDCTDWSETSTTIALNNTIVQSNYSQNSWGTYPAFRSITYLNGYIYALKSDGTAVLKIQYSTPANVTSIAVTMPISANTCFDICTDGVLVYLRRLYANGNAYVIGDDNTARLVGTNTTSDIIPISRSGVYLLSSNYHYSSGNAFIGMTQLTSAMMTKYTLDNAVTKTADKTAKLTYTVTEV